MTADGCWRRRLAGAVVAYCLGASVCVCAWAAQRMIRSKLHNYPNSPVEIKRSEVALVETFAAPAQSATDGATRRSQVRYANRDGLNPPTFVLQGSVLCANRSPQPVAAFALTIVAMDAFHQPIHLSGQRDAYAVQQVVASLPRGGIKDIAWQVMAGSPDVFEVVVVVTRVRFADNSLWVAPGEELVDIF